jgi:hypothetical protein
MTGLRRCVTGEEQWLCLETVAPSTRAAVARAGALLVLVGLLLLRSTATKKECEISLVKVDKIKGINLPVSRPLHPHHV